MQILDQNDLVATTSTHRALCCIAIQAMPTHKSQEQPSCCTSLAEDLVADSCVICSIGLRQLWLRDCRWILACQHCLCYSLTQLSWHPLDSGLNTIDTDWILSPIIGQICCRYLSRSNNTECSSCATVKQRLGQANISSTWTSWLTAFLREKHAYFTPEDPALTWSQFVSPAGLCTHQPRGLYTQNVIVLMLCPDLSISVHASCQTLLLTAAQRC